jgi:hypothetical protein
MENIKLLNVRKFLLTIIVFLALTDILVVYPRYSTINFFPNKLGVILEASFGYPLILVVALSYCKRFADKRVLIKSGLLLSMARSQFAFWNVPEETLPEKLQVYAARCIAHSFIIMMLTQLMSTVNRNY